MEKPLKMCTQDADEMIKETIINEETGENEEKHMLNGNTYMGCK